VNERFKFITALMKGEMMKKAVWMVAFLMMSLPLALCAVEKNVAHRIDLEPALDNGDLFPVASPLIQQIMEARDQGDLELYESLIDEFEQTLPEQPNNAPIPRVEKVEGQSSPIMRWGNDVVLYNDVVYYNSWSVPVGGVDDEAISVDCHIGDTLLAAVSRPDSLMAILKSYDGGMSWSHVSNLVVGGYQLLEPEVIYARNGHYHIFMRCTWNNGSILVFNFDAAGNWTAPWIVTSADTVADYTVCSDRSGYASSYFFYLSYHKQLGGEGQDEIEFTRSLDQGETWATPAPLQGNGSGFPDLRIGNYPHLYGTHSFWNGNKKYIYTRRSADAGVNWQSSIQICSDGDSVNFMGPQIACSHDYTDDAWVMFARQDPYTSNLDYGLCWSWSQDAGATWSTWYYVNSLVDYNEVLPSINVHDGYYDSLYYPYVTCIRSYYDWADPLTLSYFWDTDSAWSAEASYNDSVPALTRPIQTWETAGVPAMAYVGENGNRVYFDAWSVSVEEENPAAQEASLGKAHPNPFSARTRIELTLPKTSSVSVKAYNILGQEVSTIFNGMKNAGTHSIEWKGTDNNGNRLPSGIYFMRIKTPYHTSSKKLILQ
jgi:hypothetical protein